MRGGSGRDQHGGGDRSAVTVTRNTLRQQIAEALCDEILAGRLPAGRHVTVKEIAEQYGVSATPVREALVDLAAQGLVDMEHHRGFQVHSFTLDDFRHMVEARALIVDGIFRYGTEHLLRGATARAFASVRRRADEAERASRAGDLDILIGYDLRFWRELGSLAGNPYIADFLHRMRMQCWAFAVPYLRQEPDLRGRLWSGHRTLIEAVERRDPAAAQRLMADYDDHSLRILEKLMQDR
ncbi:GntR family transcriptional regulator [Streptomyces sp. NPDC047108]|uniref:GntR family transcriptional regulator n=1 Tax=Streptomyces sp. NPDC047108 TaxID=3155025 RepID=UPI0033FD7D3F